MMNSDLVDSILQSFSKGSGIYLSVESGKCKIEASKYEDYCPVDFGGASVGMFGRSGKGFSGDGVVGEKKQDKRKHFHDIKSLHVGFVHRREVAGDRTFIKLREVVEKGQVLAYIRSMNIMHDVVADIKGKVIEVLIEDGQAVEYGQPLFRLKPVDKEQ